MLNKNKVSIVMPAYNSAENIKNSIESILKQKYSNWELLIVDDGSVDATLKICKSYAQIDKRIKVYSQTNSGPSAARNKALSRVSGELLMFVDADDTLEENALSILTNKFEDKDLDLCIFSWNIVKENKKEVHQFSDKELNGELEDYFRNIAYSLKWDMYSGGYPWNKIWRIKTIFQNGIIFFDESVHLLEDRLFVLMAIDKIKKFEVINRPLYNYNITENSISHSSDLNKVLSQRFNCYKAMKIEFNYIKNFHFNAIDVAKKTILQGQIDFLWLFFKRVQQNNQAVQASKIIDEFKNNKFRYLSLKYTIKYIWLWILLKNNKLR